MVMIAVLLLTSLVEAQVISRTVTAISPNEGSSLGSTRITITGTGFSTDYAAGENLVEIDGNLCVTVEKQGGGVCMGKCSNSERIICDTPAHVQSDWLTLRVTIDRQYPIVNSLVKFRYRNAIAGSMSAIYPAQGKVGTILNLQGSGWNDFLDPFYRNILINPSNGKPKPFVYIYYS